jgi:hypothetical protein
VRGTLALFFIVYGVAKLMGTQFIRSGPTLDLLISEASGFELTWAYFGYSSLYSYSIAFGQIVFGGMLLFNRTQRLGALCLAVIVLNIVLVNVAYRISTPTTVLTFILLALNLYLIARDLPALKRFFWDDTASAGSRRQVVYSAGLCAAFLLAAASFVALVKAQDESVPLLGGDWSVDAITVSGVRVSAFPGTDGTWEKVYFEPNGLFGIRTDRGLVFGQHSVSAADSVVRLRFGTSSHRRSRAASVDRSHGTAPAESLIETEFRYALASDGSQLTLSTQREGAEVSVLLRPWQWPKF